MPLYYKEQQSDLLWGLWHINEAATYLATQCRLSPEGAAQLALLKGKRREEWLAGRVLLQTLLQEEVPLQKDDNGKPYVSALPMEVSISHTESWAAVAVALQPIGIDIQVLTPKLERIAPKFLHAHELAQLATAERLRHLHLYWCIKEALFKAYSRKALDWRHAFEVTPFAYAPLGTTQARVHAPTQTLHYEVHFRMLPTFALAYAVLKV